MATGLQRTHGLPQFLRGLEPGSEHWIDAEEKFNLRKLSVSDLVAQGVGEQQAEIAVAGLRRQDLSGLADALGIHLRVKFKIWAERDGSICKIKVDGADNAEWLRSYLSSVVPNIRVSEAVKKADGRYIHFTVTFDDASGPWRLQRVLIDCPAIIAMQIPIVHIIERPHYRLEARDLATWIDRQGESVWWSIDGDHLLAGQVHSPCPPEELSAALRSIDRPLRVDDPDDLARGETLRADDVDRAITVDRLGFRQLYLNWEGGESDWLLWEDEELLQSES
ncbi:MAG TPA: hypothetical protein VNH11_01575 [Pirellulales bacterium]|nr:hypothetical protein [Pirellulales bacterium]